MHDPDGPQDLTKETIIRETPVLLDQIYEWSKKLYAEKKQSLLVVLQGMDASGKDGLTRELFKPLSPAWLKVHAFKKPTPDERAYDFLHRVHAAVPPKGVIGIFNRSHYEDVLVPAVYGTCDKKTLAQRYEQINDFERMLEQNGTKILKCYMHLSYEKQEIKLRERIDTPEKHWKHSDEDWETRKKWNAFMKAYEKVFAKCNEVPWHILPCDKNSVKLYCAAQLVLETLKKMDPKFPPLESAHFTPNYEKAKITY